MQGKKQIKSRQKPIPRPDALHKRGDAKTLQNPLKLALDPSYARFLVIAFILIITFIAFFPSLQNSLLKAWDDQDYVTNNDLVKSLSADNILKIFREDKGNMQITIH